jgi:hypothetical protein
VIDKSLLHRMQRTVGAGEAFDGGDFLTLCHRDEGEAGQNAAAVDHDRAGAALTMVAAFLGTGEPDMFAQGIEQCGAAVEVEIVLLAVDGQRHVDPITRGQVGYFWRGFGLHAIKKCDGHGRLTVVPRNVRRLQPEPDLEPSGLGEFRTLFCLSWCGHDGRRLNGPRRSNAAWARLFLKIRI